MKRRLIYIILGLFLGSFFMGCSHTIDKLSRFNTGRVDAGDIAEALVKDELAFRKAYW
jgi:hypothetical protein